MEREEEGARVNEAFSSLPLPFSAAKKPFHEGFQPGKNLFAKYYFIQIKGKYVTENELLYSMCNISVGIYSYALATFPMDLNAQMQYLV